MSGKAARHNGEASRGTLLIVAIVLGSCHQARLHRRVPDHCLSEMKIALGLSNTSFGALATARQATSGATTTLGAGYLGDRFSNQAGLLLAISLSLMGISYFLVGAAPKLSPTLSCHAAGRLGAFSVSPTRSRHSKQALPRPPWPDDIPSWHGRAVSARHRALSSPPPPSLRLSGTGALQWSIIPL